MKTWRDKEDSEASMASLEKALRDMGRSDIADNFKQLAYSSYSKDPVVVVETRHFSPSKVSTQSSAPVNRRISEFLDSVGESDDMFGGDEIGSPRLQRASVDGEEVFSEVRTITVESSPEPIIEESVIVVEKHRVVDEDGNVIEETQKIIEDGNEVTEDREKLLQDFFANDKGVLDFLTSDKDGTVENGAEETEIWRNDLMSNGARREIHLRDRLWINKGQWFGKDLRVKCTDKRGKISASGDKSSCRFNIQSALL